MARTSKHPLTLQQQIDLSRQLTEVIGRMSTSLAQEFLHEFLGPEEKLMLAKRLAIIALIHEKRSIHRIATYLHVSESTVAKLQDRYKQHAFSATIKALTHNKIDYRQFVELLDAILTVGGIMPHRNYIIRPKRKKR